MANITINYNNILNTAEKGVQRAAIFLGLGINASRNPDVTHGLQEHTLLQFTPDGLDANVVGSYKEEFTKWIIRNGLRELQETFNIFLDQIYEATLKISVSIGNIDQTEKRDLISEFREAAFKDKFHKLIKNFDIKCDNPDYLYTINSARNALTHNLGQVRAKDCNSNKCLNVKWLGLDLVAIEGNKTTNLGRKISKPFLFKEDGYIGIKPSVRQKRFKVGEYVDFSAEELTEICLTFKNQAYSINNSAIEYAKSMGITYADES